MMRMFLCVIWFDVFFGGVVVFIGDSWKIEGFLTNYMSDVTVDVQVYRPASKWKLLNCNAYFALAYGCCIVN